VPRVSLREHRRMGRDLQINRTRDPAPCWLGDFTDKIARKHERSADAVRRRRRRFRDRYSTQRPRRRALSQVLKQETREKILLLFGRAAVEAPQNLESARSSPRRPPLELRENCVDFPRSSGAPKHL
jgi:hypothetical protein